jgi:two-component system OmpR family response regulator
MPPTTLTAMRILVAEDDPTLAEVLCTRLRDAGHESKWAPNGPVASYLARQDELDAVILDLGLPLQDGMQVLGEIRQTHSDLPILILSARDALEDRVRGLQGGADDYLIKPFEWAELLARLQAITRRRASATHAQTQCRNLTLDEAARRACVDGRTVELSGREWGLLHLLLQRQGQVVTKAQILQAWAEGNPEADLGNTIEVYIHRLRRKLDGAGVVIRTIRGLGYLLEAAPSNP